MVAKQGGDARSWLDDLNSKPASVARYVNFGEVRESYRRAVAGGGVLPQECNLGQEQGRERPLIERIMTTLARIASLEIGIRSNRPAFQVTDVGGEIKRELESEGEIKNGDALLHQDTAKCFERVQKWMGRCMPSF